jgi:hypothetical protein
MSGGDHLISDSRTGCFELGLGEGAVFFLPLGNGAQSFSNEERSAGGGGHPGRDARPLVGRCGQDLLVDIGINRNCELR